MGDDHASIPADYACARERWRGCLARLRDLRPEARLCSHRLPGAENLTIDWITAPAAGAPRRALLVTAGLHGIEGFVGSAVLELLVDQVLPKVDSSVALCLVPAINPWGMAHWRRTNAANVDLNRNCVARSAELDPYANPDYERLDLLLNPRRKLRHFRRLDPLYLIRLVSVVARWGIVRGQAAALSGQSRHAEGLYFGGREIQPETQLLKRLIGELLAENELLVHLDLHTGYGPRYQMTLVNSPLEARTSAALAEAFDYPRVVTTLPGEFYPIRGDLIDYVYRVGAAQAHAGRLYATTLAFGTLGDSLPARFRSLQIMIADNQLHRYGVGHQGLARRVREELIQLYAPADERWLACALAGAERAITGILRHQGYLADLEGAHACR